MKIKVELCLGSSCFARGNRDILSALEQFIKKNHNSQKLEVLGSLCLGRCSDGPVVKIDDTVYLDKNEQDILAIIQSKLSGIYE